MTAMIAVGDQEAAEPADVEAEVPAVEVAGDDGADPQRPQGPHARVTPESTLLEVVLTYLVVGDRAEFAFRHG